MPRFSQHSLVLLDTCDIRLVRIMTDVVKEFDISIISGRRNQEEQNELFRQGLSQRKWPDSNHNVYPLSRAVDIAPFPIEWEDRERFVYMAGYVMGVASKHMVMLKWGGDWNRDWEVKDEMFRDLGHFELVKNDTEIHQ